MRAALADARWWSRSPDRETHAAAVTWGARALASRRGARNNRERLRAFVQTGSVPFTRRCSAHAARRSNSPSSLPPPRRSLPRAPSSPRKRRRPRKGYAERVVRRHGSLRPLTTGHRQRKLGPGRARPRTVALLPCERAQLASGWRHPERETEMAGPRFLHRERGSDGASRPNADRGGSLARRRIHGSRACPRVEHALQRSVGSHEPREARLKPRRPMVKVMASVTGPSHDTESCRRRGADG